ncbi:hypothetical protein [Planomonospora parontospora]|uniref:hypothetical protein n=1 Tax=Planomonospora parontospora TaxID=58119 RepID=UPI0016717303|nr:hypothetical protein [Planomonospora parontospora]GGL51599.1 hypothetical protein GCM10014719_61150 [Planomonospora parontospora subsp. antibiotica]GII19613.1 hypothetical protein Ppa05_63390 [Planomonospora parontospora subsp. antibiotica]
MSARPVHDPPAAGVVRLPHTGLQVPDARLRVVRCRPRYASRWEYRALLVRGEQRVGHIRGPLPDVAEPGPAGVAGGGPVVSFHPRGRAFTEADLEDFAAACRLDGQVLSSARVLTLLVDEYRIEQMVRGCARRGGVMARCCGEGWVHYIPLRAYPRSAGQCAAALAQLERASGVGGPWRIWDGRHWSPLSVGSGPDTSPGCA